MAEGFLEITGIQLYIRDMMYEYAPGGPFGDWVPYNPELAAGEKADFNIRVKNTGVTDDFRLEIWDATNNLLLLTTDFPCPAGVEDWVYPGTGLVLTMGNTDVTINVITYHYQP